MVNDVDRFIGKRIRRRRRLLGLTQQQLAEAINGKYQRIHAYEAALCRISASKLYEIAVALNVPIAYFFEGLVAAPTQQQG